MHRISSRKEAHMSDTNPMLTVRDAQRKRPADKLRDLKILGSTARRCALFDPGAWESCQVTAYTLHPPRTSVTDDESAAREKNRPEEKINWIKLDLYFQDDPGRPDQVRQETPKY